MVDNKYYALNSQARLITRLYGILVNSPNFMPPNSSLHSLAKL